MAKTILSTAFPYVYGIPHMGNLCQAVKVDMFTKLRNSLGQDSCFPYSYHLTGLPTYLRILELNSQVWDEESYLKQKNLTYLKPYMSGLEDLGTPRAYVETLNRYYTQVFKRLRVQTNLPKYHTTTDIDQNYSKFVNLLYGEIFKQNYIKEELHHTIYCDRCKNALGDHDRVHGEGLGLEKRTFKVSSFQGKPVIYTTNSMVETENLYISLDLYKLFRKERRELLFIKGKNYYLGEEVKREVTWTPISYEELEVYYTSKGITCRCGGSGIIDSRECLLIDFERPEWKALVEKKILESSNEEVVKNILLSNSRKLRKMAFLREKGFGTTLDILNETRYRHLLVDSLMDSFLHPIYYSLFLEDKDTSKKNLEDALKKYDFKLHSVGVDLLNNHVLFYTYFLTVLYPDRALPYFQTHRFLKGPDDEKMSKSKGNILYLEDLQKEGIEGSDFRLYLCSLGDNTEPTKFDLKTCKKEGQVGKKHLFEVLNHLDDMNPNDPFFKSLNLVALLTKVCILLEVDPQKVLGIKKEDLGCLELRPRTYYKQYSKKRFLLRELYYLVSKQLRSILRTGNPKPGPAISPTMDLKTVLKNLALSF